MDSKGISKISEFDLNVIQEASEGENSIDENLIHVLNSKHNGNSNRLLKDQSESALDMKSRNQM